MPKKKYDTNPLDPEFPQQARAAQARTLPDLNADTRQFPFAASTEEQTKKFDNADFSSYSNAPFDNQNAARNYQTAHFASGVENSEKRAVSKIGLPENILTALPYIPFYVGLIAGILILFLVPKSETKARFHAAQGLAAHVAILIVSSVLSGIGHVTDLADFGNMIFNVAAFVMLVIWTIKALADKPVHIEAVDDLTNWLEDKIKPRG